MKTKATIACTLALLSLSARVFAQAPVPPVTGVTANALNGQVVVQWNAIHTMPIEYYRVYYSNFSIIDNEGLYDDFEVTPSNETTLTFVPPSQFNDLYIAVIAVAPDGQESEFFIEETYIKVSTGGDSQPVPSTPDAPVIPEHTTLKLLKGEAVSPTEIRTEFSLSVVVDPARAPEGLHITRPDGSELAIKEIELTEKIILIRTETQEKGTVYNVQFSEPFEGKNGQPLDEDDRAVLVSGHSDGKAPVPRAHSKPPPPPPPPVVQNPHVPLDVLNATISAAPQANGLHTVTMEWVADNTAGDLYGIVVYQTLDGATFGPPSLLPLDIRGVQIQGVSNGFYGLYVQTVNMYGVTSPGVFQYITLPVSRLQGSVHTPSATTDTSGMIALEVIMDNEHTKPAAQGTELTRFDWEATGLFAAITAGVVIVLVATFAMIASRERGSMEVQNVF